MILANDPQIRSFIHVNEKHPFPIQNLAFGIFSDKKIQRNALVLRLETRF